MQTFSSLLLFGRTDYVSTFGVVLLLLLVELHESSSLFIGVGRRIDTAVVFVSGRVELSQNVHAVFLIVQLFVFFRVVERVVHHRVIRGVVSSPIVHTASDSSSADRSFSVRSSNVS